MATKFKITETTKRTSLKISGVLAVVGQEYDIALEDNVTIDNTFGFPAEPLDNFKYKIIKNGIESINEGIVEVNFETDKSTNPDLFNEVFILPINGSLLLSSVVAPTNRYDRIKITEITGKGKWLLDGSEIEIGNTIFYYQLLNNLIFVANESGSKDSYNILKWNYGTIAFDYPTENTITIDTTSLGVLVSESNITEAEDFITYEQYITNLDIQKGKAIADFELVIDTTAFPNIGIDSENEIKILINEVETVYNTSGTFTLAGVLTESGEASIQCIVNRKKPSTVTSSIKITLSTIDGLSTNVDALNNEQTILIPITII